MQRLIVDLPAEAGRHRLHRLAATLQHQPAHIARPAGPLILARQRLEAVVHERFQAPTDGGQLCWRDASHTAPSGEWMVLVVDVDAARGLPEPLAGGLDQLCGTDVGAGDDRRVPVVAEGTRPGSDDPDLGVDVGKPVGEARGRLGQPVDRKRQPRRQ